MTLREEVLELIPEAINKKFMTELDNGFFTLTIKKNGNKTDVTINVRLPKDLMPMDKEKLYNHLLGLKRKDIFSDAEKTKEAISALDSFEFDVEHYIPYGVKHGIKDKKFDFLGDEAKQVLYHILKTL